MKCITSGGISSRRSASEGTRTGTHVETVIKIFAEAPVGDFRAQVARGRRDHAGIDLHPRGTRRPRWNVWSTSTRRILAWVSSGMSPTSSR